MLRKGIDPATCPQASIVKAICSPAELEFADTLRHALDPKKVLVLVKVRVLDVIELENDPDKKRLFFWRDMLGDQHFDYVVCSKKTLAPILAVELDGTETVRRRTTTG